MFPVERLVVGCIGVLCVTEVLPSIRVSLDHAPGCLGNSTFLTMFLLTRLA